MEEGFVVIALVISVAFFIFILITLIRMFRFLKTTARQTERSAMYLKKLLEKNGVTEEEIREIKEILDKKYY